MTDVNVTGMPSVTVGSLPVVDADVIALPAVTVGSLPDVSVDSLPDLAISEIGPMGPLTLAGIPNSYTLAISSLPDLNLNIREIPRIRAHIPANFRLGISVLGVEVAALSLCGEAQVITEPYRPNPCEICGEPREGLANLTNEVAAVLHLTERQ